ncbi:hypothetical protein [Halobacterium sp. CBA1126]|uniref:DUF7537 family lipoprotein n=1 Tax=Halobacterium TaxID=2239 RepID=UPI0012F95E23|nr:hypothetical protein [Halobacterium sp. CBA1126]MUV59473.1 hypothetical protein [Halobacterium sp. CBA1126]
MHRRPFLTVAVLGLLLLAGCAGIGSSPATTSDYPETVSITDERIDRHAAALNDTSFTTVLAITQAGDTSSRIEYQIDPAAQRYLQHSMNSFANTTVYTAGNWTQQRFQYGNQTRVSQSDQAVNVTSARRGVEPIATYVSPNATFERNGTHTFDGDEVMAYETAGTDALRQSFRNSTGANTTVTDFSGTVAVDDRGRIRQFTGEFEYTQGDQTITTTLTATVSQLNDTDVEEPGWISN